MNSLYEDQYQKCYRDSFIQKTGMRIIHPKSIRFIKITIGILINKMLEDQHNILNLSSQCSMPGNIANNVT